MLRLPRAQAPPLPDAAEETSRGEGRGGVCGGGGVEEEGHSGAGKENGGGCGVEGARLADVQGHPLPAAALYRQFGRVGGRGRVGGWAGSTGE